MQIISVEDNLHGMSKPFFLDQYEKIYIYIIKLWSFEFAQRVVKDSFSNRQSMKKRAIEKQ